jgi:hypothetical protein
MGIMDSDPLADFSGMVKFCRARCGEDEVTAETAGGDGPQGRWEQVDPESCPGRIDCDSGYVVTYDEGSPDDGQAPHIARHDPARVLREVAAKRAVLDSYEASVRSVGPGLSRSQLRPVAAQAAIWSDHPGYEEGWKL